jgi:hypothetical protein
MKAYWESGDIAPFILTLALDRGERSASRPGRFTPRGSNCMATFNLCKQTIPGTSVTPCMGVKSGLSHKEKNIEQGSEENIWT